MKWINNKYAYLSIIIILLSSHNIAVSKDNVHFGKVQRIEADGRNSIYVTSSDGLHEYWANYLGSEWHKVVYADDVAIKDFLVMKSDFAEMKMLAVTGENHLIMSEDGGCTFTDITPSFVNDASKTAITHMDSYVDGSIGNDSPNRVFLSCAGDNAGIYYSSDLCKSWEKIYEGSVDLFTAYACYEDTLLVIGYTDTENTAHICTSTDNGASWKPLYSKPEAQASGVTFHPGVGVSMMCIYGENLLAMTTDKGKTWTEMTALPSIVDVSFQYNNTCEIYAAVNDESAMGLWNSQNLGQTWTCACTLPTQSLDPIIDMEVSFYDIYMLTQSGHLYYITYHKNKYEYVYDYKTLFSGVNTLPLDELQTSYYDLMGRSIVHPTRGIYIKEGKKVVIGK